MSQYRASDKQLQELYVDQELVTAISTIESGLAILQNNRLYRRNEFPVMLLLSTGIERLLKVVLHLAIHDAEGRFHKLGRTHSLGDLRTQVLGKVFTQSYLAKPNMQADHDLLANDALLGEIFMVLTDFADSGGRYIYMDSITNPNLPEAADRWPSRQWARLETAIIKRLGEPLNVKAVEEQHHFASHHLVITIERFMRIVGRMHAFGGLGELGKRYSAYLSHFTRMGESDFGRTSYVV